MKAKREHILETALQLFAEKGFEGASIRDIAERACVNVAMVNYYFGSKEKLFEKIIEHKSLATRGRLDEILHNERMGPMEKIEAVVDFYIAKGFDHRQFHRLVQQELILGERQNLQDAIVDNFVPNTLIVKKIIESAIASGQFRPVDIELTIAMLNGTINQLLLSTRYCNKLMNNHADYVPYQDEQFKQRIAAFLKRLMRTHLLPQAA